MTVPIRFQLPPNLFMEERMRAYLDFIATSLIFLMDGKAPHGVGFDAPVYTYDQYLNWLSDNSYFPFGDTPAPYPPPPLP